MMGKGLSEQKLTEVAATWQWRDRFGNFIHPVDMETSHIFHTVSMIWNHVMPENARTHDYRRYTFSSFYTPFYFKVAIRALLTELATRKDLTPAMEYRFKFMQSYLLRNAPQVKEVENDPRANPPNQVPSNLRRGLPRPS